MVNGRKIKKMVKVLKSNKWIGVLGLISGGRYNGNWVADIRNGQGVQYYDNGTKYDGEWKDNKKHGKGII